MAEYWVIHGPNLNLLGTREPDVYGSVTLKQLDDLIQQEGNPHTVRCFQSNAEHELVERVHELQKEKVAGLVLNPAAFTHTSVALRDALSAVNLPFIEVHISNVYAREPFRKTSFFSDIAEAVITGFGTDGYLIALKHLIKQGEMH
jgi:3-dehydroquinate dehydratase-2